MMVGEKAQAMVLPALQITVALLIDKSIFK
jgi:hypothetical protein